MSSGLPPLSHTSCQLPNILSVDRCSYQKSSALLTALDALLRHHLSITAIVMSVPSPVSEWDKPAAYIEKNTKSVVRQLVFGTADIKTCVNQNDFQIVCRTQYCKTRSEILI